MFDFEAKQGRSAEAGRETPPVRDAFTFLGPLGSGRRCTTWLALRQGRSVVVKRFTEAAIAKHRSRHGVPLARFEFERNLSLYRIPALRGCVARPVAFITSAMQQFLVQEFVSGLPLLEFAQTAGKAERSRVHGQLAGIVSTAHAAGIYDLDLHADNVLVRHAPGESPRVVLFDFNKIPYHEWPPNAVARRLVAWGCIKPGSRDRRHLRKCGRALRVSS